jgi:hypothetical protein
MKGNGIDEAIRKVDIQPVEKRANLDIRLASGRTMSMNTPADITESELLDLIGYLGGQLPGQIRQAREQSTLVVPPRTILRPA